MDRTVHLMPEVEPILADLWPIYSTNWDDKLVDVKVHMLMPGQFPCIPNFHRDFMPRDGEGARCAGEPSPDPMYMWISGAPLTEYIDKDTGRIYTKPAMKWHTFFQADVHRGAASEEHTWRCFIRVIPKHFVHCRQDQIERGWPDGKLASCPILISLRFLLPRPKSHFVAGDRSRPLRADAPLWHTPTPDRDNLEKAVLDALGGFDDAPSLVWVDDSRVVAGPVEKFYSNDSPGVLVSIFVLDSNTMPDLEKLVPPESITPGETLEVSMRRSRLGAGPYAELLGISSQKLLKWRKGDPEAWTAPVLPLTACEVCLVLRLRHEWTAREVAHRSRFGYAWVTAVDRGEINDPMPLIAWWADMLERVSDLKDRKLDELLS